MHANSNEWGEIINVDDENCTRLFEDSCDEMEQISPLFKRACFFTQSLGCGSSRDYKHAAPPSTSRYSRVFHLIPETELMGDTKGYNPLVDFQAE